MTFETLEESRCLGQPVDLYYFRYGTTASAYYAYTDAEEPVTFDGVIYEPKPIQRGAINSSGTLDKSALTVDLPTSCDVAELFRIYPPGRSVALIIRQGHLGDADNDFKVIWSGRILSSSREDSVDSLTCEPLSTAFRRSGLRRCYQYSCPHALYGEQCKASRLAGTSAATVYATTGASVTLDSGWNGSHAVEKYIGGMVEWETAAEVGSLGYEVLRVDPASGAATPVHRAMLPASRSAAISLASGVLGPVSRTGSTYSPRSNPASVSLNASTSFIVTRY